MLNIPVLELELPVLKVWGSENLKIAPCWYYGSVYTRDMVICAHNYTNHFGRLNLLVKGDRVDLTDMDGNVFHYRVALKEELPGSAVEEMNSGEWDLTLYTCTTGGQSRVTVRCSLVDAEEK